METDKGFSVFMLTSINPEGAKPFEEVKAIVTNRAKLEKSKEKGREFASGYVTKIQENNIWLEIAESDDSKIIRFDSTTTFKIRASVPKLGYNPDFNAVAFSLKKDLSAKYE